MSEVITGDTSWIEFSGALGHAHHRGSGWEGRGLCGVYAAPLPGPASILSLMGMLTLWDNPHHPWWKN